MKLQATSLLVAELSILGTCRAEHGVGRFLSLADKRMRSLQDGIPLVGVQTVSSSASSLDISKNVVKMVEADGQVTVTDMEPGELICDYLEDAADAPVLQLAVTDNKVITAEQISFTVVSEEEVEDGMGRMVWTGEVVDPELAADETSRIVTLTYAEECTAEIFLMIVTTDLTDGTTEVLKSVPCDVIGAEICLFKTVVDFLPVGDPANLLPDPSTFRSGGGSSSSSTASISVGGRRLRSTRSVRSLGKNAKQAKRELGSTTVISVMFLFTPEAQTVLGDVSITQMVSFILAGLALTNDAFRNSEIPLEFGLVFIGMAPFTQPTSTPGALVELTSNADVAALRHLYEADLVQLIGGFTDFCALGWQFPGGCDFGFSVASPTCFAGFSHTHAFGRNLGCFPNRDVSPVQTDFSHGHQACDVATPFHTIMAVPCDTVESGRINYFSNPDVNVLGIFPTGTSVDNNALQIEETMVEISLCRPIEPIEPILLPTPAPVTMIPTTPKPTTSPPVATAFTFLACYVDSVDNRVLSGPSELRNSMQSTEACAAFCEGFTFFGTEFGNECFCGNDEDSPSLLGPATCDFPCEGNAAQLCGGFEAISVYEFV